MTDVVSAIDLVKRFRSVPVLDGLNLTVSEGSVFCLAGPNGAGKTTTIKILMNILRPTSGQASVLGVDSLRLTTRARRVPTRKYVDEGDFQAAFAAASVETLAWTIHPA